MEHLLSSWSGVIEQLQKAKQVLFLSDFDGTLTPITEKPDLVEMSEKTRRLLEALSNQEIYKIGIISGRSLTDLKKKVNIEGIVYAGNHGFEIEGPGFHFVNPEVEKILPLLRPVRQILSMAQEKIRGILVEDKGITLSVHYRQVDEKEIEDVRLLVENAVKGPLSLGILKVTQGKKVYELRPAVPWDKGKAIRFLMKRYGKGGRRSGLVPVYLGDDFTDEDGFRTIEKYGNGISVYVGELKPDSAARYYLKSTDEVLEFLSRLSEHIQRSLPGEQLPASRIFESLPDPASRF